MHSLAIKGLITIILGYITGFVYGKLHFELLSSYSLRLLLLITHRYQTKISKLECIVTPSRKNS